MLLNKKKTEDEYQQTLDYIVENLPKVCKRCGCKANLIRDGYLVLLCTWKSCKFKQSLFEGTIFSRAKIDKIKVLEILDCWMAKCPNGVIPWITGCSYDSVLRVLKAVKKLAVPRHHASLNQVGDIGTIVEIDESKFGKRKNNRGHHVEGVWVLGMVEKTEKRRIVLAVVDNRTKGTLNSKIVAHVNGDSTIHTDCWKGYVDVKDICFEHKTVNHSKGFINPLDGTHTNTIEGCWYAIKAQTPVRNRTSSKVCLYLLRFMILRNEEGDPLLNLLKYLIYLLLTWITHIQGDSEVTHQGNFKEENFSLNFFIKVPNMTVRLSRDEKVELIFMYGVPRATNRSVTEAFNRQNPNRSPISQVTVGRLKKRFREAGSIADHPRGGRRRSVTSEESPAAVLAHLRNSPKKSTRKLGQETGPSQASVVRILQKNHFHPYKMHLTQELHGDDTDRRRRFCEWMRQNTALSILFSDEAIFYLSGNVNRHNFRYWSDTNPHWMKSTRVQVDPRVMVWAGILED